MIVVYNQLEKLEAAKPAWQVCLSLLSLTGSVFALLGQFLLTLTVPFLICYLTEWLTDTVHLDLLVCFRTQKWMLGRVLVGVRDVMVCGPLWCPSSWSQQYHSNWWRHKAADNILSPLKYLGVSSNSSAPIELPILLTTLHCQQWNITQ